MPSHYSTYFSICTLCLLLVTKGISQFPMTNVYLAEFTSVQANTKLKSIHFVNGFNPSGYNNQAKWASSHDFYMTVAMDTQRITEIYHFDIQTKSYYKVSNTSHISEFSPTLSHDQKRLTTVRIESDGKDQSLWSYPLDRKDQGYRLFPKLKNVGYFTWLGKDSIAMFLVGNPHQLVIGDISQEAIVPIANNIGRCIKSDGNGHIFYVEKLRPDLWVLKSYHLEDKASKTICQMPIGREDFEILSNGSFIIGDGSSLKWLNPKVDKSWTEICNFQDFSIKNIQRPAVSGNKILFVDVTN